MQLSEAEIQVLATLALAGEAGSATDRASLEAEAERFLEFQENWSEAYGSLTAKGLITGDDAGYSVTDNGRPLAEHYHAQRPDHYWYKYQSFYPAALASEAHSELCRRVFGEDLTQEGQADMAELKALLGQLDLKPDERVIDLGCGAGVIAEYIAEQTGAKVTGLDYAASAIEQARARTASKNAKLSFMKGDLNQLELGEGSFDAITSFDTLYWAADLDTTVTKLAASLASGGRMGIFMNQYLEEGDDPTRAQREQTDLYQALNRLGLAFESTDYTESLAAFWHRLGEAAHDLHPAFEAEGNGFVSSSLIRETDDHLPAIESGRLTRYLYFVRV